MINATQGASTNQPIFTPDAIKTSPSIKFDGINDRMDFAGNVFTNTSYTFFIVQRRLAGTTGSPISGVGTGNNQLDMIMSNTTLNIAHGSDGSTVSTLPAFTTPITRVISHTHDVTNGNHTYINGVNTGNRTSGTPDMAPNYNGRVGNRANGLFFNGFISEIIMYAREFSLSEIKETENDYLFPKYL